MHMANVLLTLGGERKSWARGGISSTLISTSGRRAIGALDGETRRGDRGTEGSLTGLARIEQEVDAMTVRDMQEVAIKMKDVALWRTVAKFRSAWHLMRGSEEHWKWLQKQDGLPSKVNLESSKQWADWVVSWREWMDDIPGGVHLLELAAVVGRQMYGYLPDVDMVKRERMSALEQKRLFRQDTAFQVWVPTGK